MQRFDFKILVKGKTEDKIAVKAKDYEDAVKKAQDWINSKSIEIELVEE